MALESIDPTYAKVRIAGLNAQIAEHKESIKRLEKKKSVFTNAKSTKTENDDVTDVDDSK